MEIDAHINEQLLHAVIDEFNIDNGIITFNAISQGYINDTYQVVINGIPKYILQRVNVQVFKDPERLHKNIFKALKKLKAKDYQSIRLIVTKNEKPYCFINNGYWRMLTYISDSVAYNITSNRKIAYEAGRIIGRFHQLMDDEDTTVYPETVKNLNYLPFWKEAFLIAQKNAPEELLKASNTEIEFANRHLSLFDDFYEANLTRRVCHNDTKLNNILFDRAHNALCLIDPDTIMSGYFHYDFGDAGKDSS